MSWKPIIKNEIGEGIPYVGLSAQGRSTGRASHSQMVLRLSASLAHLIQVQPGERVLLEIGTLADEGWMKVSKGKEQKATNHGHEGSIQVRFSGRRLGVTETHSFEHMKYKKGNGSVLFLLPAWARRKEE
jgi:hypothetical protein